MVTKSELTNRQQQVLDMLTAYQQQNGLMPTNAEVAVMMGASSPNAAAEQLRALQRKGAITIIPHVSRGIILNAKSSGTDPEAVSLIRALLIGDENARANAVAFLERYEGAV